MNYYHYIMNYLRIGILASLPWNAWCLELVLNDGDCFIGGCIDRNGLI